MKPSVLLSAVFILMGVSCSSAQTSMNSEQWANKAANAALCDNPPCSSLDIAKLIGPMRTEQEWRKLAEEGDKAAQSQQCSAHGFKNDVEPDYYAKVVSWCQNDAELGSGQAEYLLAKLYTNGQGGLAQNWGEAYFWYAVRITDKNISPVERDEAAKHLTPQQLQPLDERIAKWKEKLCATNPTERNAKVERGWHCDNN
jgi:hypothetical protein